MQKRLRARPLLYDCGSLPNTAIDSRREGRRVMRWKVNRHQAEQRFGGIDSVQVDLRMKVIMHQRVTKRLSCPLQDELCALCCGNPVYERCG